MNGDMDLSGNSEIQEALKEFEVKSSITQVQKSVVAEKASGVPKMVGWVMKISGGAITEQKTAEYVLLGLVVVLVGVSIFLFTWSGGDSPVKLEALPGTKIIYPEGAPPRLEKIF